MSVRRRSRSASVRRITAMKPALFAASLIALAAAAPLALVTTPLQAEAAPGSNPGPFAGSYSGRIYYNGGGTEGYFPPYWLLDVTISDAGKISGVANFYAVFPGNIYGFYSSPAGDGAASGSLSADGTLRLSVTDGKYHERMSATVTVDSTGVITCQDGRLGLRLAPQ